MIPGIVAQASPGESSGEGAGTTELLLGFNGANNAKVFVDEGRVRRPVCWVGNTKIDTSQARFGTSSAYFDGARDGLLIPPGPGLLFGGGMFTVECFARPQSIGTLRPIITHRSGGDISARAWSIYQLANGKVEVFLAVDDATNIALVSTSALVANTWHHIAVDVDDTNTARLYINGVMEAKQPGVIAIREFRRALCIGTEAGNGETFGVVPTTFYGWLDEVRIIKGAAIYGSDDGFPMPSAPFPRPVADLAPDPDPYFADVLLLLGFDYRTRRQVIYDDSPDSRVATQFYSLNSNQEGFRIDADQPGFGGRTNLFAKDSGLLGNFADSADWAFGTDPFCVEFWAYMTFFNTMHIVGQRPSTGTESWVATLLNTGGLEVIAQDGSTTVQFNSPAATNSRGPQTYVWNHYALTRDAAGTFRMYVNGLKEAEQAAAGFAIRDLAAALDVFSYGGGQIPFVGRLDELRVTRGAARYTGDRFDLPEKVYSRGEVAPPVFSVDPEISSSGGSFYAVGDTLTLNPGTSNGRQPTIRWRRDGAIIAGEQGETYTLKLVDAGALITADVTSWNYLGTTTATAAAVGPVAAERAYVTGALAPSGDMQSGGDRLTDEADNILLWRDRTA